MQRSADASRLSVVYTHLVRPLQGLWSLESAQVFALLEFSRFRSVFSRPLAGEVLREHCGEEALDPEGDARRNRHFSSLC